MGIVPYARFLFFPVGRGQCAPPLEVRCVSAAAHMGAALQRNLQNMRRGGGSAPPVHGHRIFIKMSFRGAQRRGNPFSLCGEGAAQGTEYGLPHRCAHRFAMTRILLGVRCMSGGGSAPPVHGRRIFIKLSFRGAQRRGNPFPPCSEGAVRGGCGCPCCGTQNFGAALRRPLKILTAATRSSRFFCHRQRSIRSPHQRARWFAMTGNFFGGAVHIGGGVRAPRPTENVFNIKCKKTDRIAPVCFFMGLLNFTDCPARRLRLRGGWARCRWSRW